MRLFVPALASCLLFASCTGAPNSSTAPDSGSDTDTDTDGDTDTETDLTPEGEPMETCWGTSLTSQGQVDELVGYHEESEVHVRYHDAVVDVETFPDGSSLAATASGTLYVHDPDGVLLDEIAIGSAGSWIQLYAAEALADGGIVVLGRFADELILGADTPQEVALSCGDAAGGLGVVLARTSSAGVLEWACGVCTDADDWNFHFVGSSLGVLSDGSIVVAGILPEGHVVFGAGEPSETDLGPFEYDPYDPGFPVFVARYLEDGTLDRVRVESVGYTVGREIAALPDGSFALTGSFMFEATFGEGQPNETTLTWSLPEDTIFFGPADALGRFVAVYAPDGALAWADGVNGFSSFDNHISVSPLADGSLAASGAYADTLEFSDGTVLHAFVELNDGSAEGGYAIFVARWSPDGDLQWVRGSQCAGSELCSVVSSNVVALPASAAPSGAMAVAGGMVGAVDFGGSLEAQEIISGHTVFFAMYGAEGTLQGVWWIGEGWEEVFEQPLSLSFAGGGAFSLGGHFNGNPLINGLGGETYQLDDTASAPETNGFLIRACP